MNAIIILISKVFNKGNGCIVCCRLHISPTTLLHPSRLSPLVLCECYIQTLSGLISNYGLTADHFSSLWLANEPALGNLLHSQSLRPNPLSYCPAEPNLTQLNLLPVSRSFSLTPSISHTQTSSSLAHIPLDMTLM